MQRHAIPETPRDACVVAALLCTIRRDNHLSERAMRRIFDDDVCRVVNDCVCVEANNVNDNLVRHSAS